jgi:hypothetical protein
MSVLGRCSGQQIFVGQQFAQRADRLDGILGILDAIEPCLDLAQFVEPALAQHLVNKLTHFGKGRDLALVRRVLDENRRGYRKIQHRGTPRLNMTVALAPSGRGRSGPL